MSRNYQIRDLVQTTEEFGGRIFVLVSFTEKGYLALSVKGGKRYTITDGQIDHKVGEASDAEMDGATDTYNEAEGIAHCRHQAREFPNESEKWNFLSTLKAGDTMRVVHRKTIYPAEFVCLNLHRPIYPIRAKIRGQTHDFRLDALLVK